MRSRTRQDPLPAHDNGRMAAFAAAVVAIAEGVVPAHDSTALFAVANLVAMAMAARNPRCAHHRRPLPYARLAASGVPAGTLNSGGRAGRTTRRWPNPLQIPQVPPCWLQLLQPQTLLPLQCGQIRLGLWSSFILISSLPSLSKKCGRTIQKDYH